jgi:hypothetical protein
MDKMQLSHVLKLKELLQQNKGSTSVRLSFFCKEWLMATMHIDISWSIALNDLLKNSLKEILSFRDIKEV